LESQEAQASSRQYRDRKARSDRLSKLFRSAIASRITGGSHSMARKYKLISADSHLEIDSKYWLDRVAEKHRDRAPRMVRTELGGDRSLLEGGFSPEVPLDLYARTR